MQFSSEHDRYIDAHADEALALLLELAVIPAPSNHEEQRAEFCRRWLEAQGAQGVYIDEALNVVWPLGDTGTNPLAVYTPHPIRHGSPLYYLCRSFPKFPFLPVLLSPRHFRPP